MWPDLQATIDAHPNLAAGITLAAGWFAPTPANCRRWLADALVLVKGATMSLDPTQIKTAVNDVQHLVKLALEYVPGNTPDEKAAELTAKLKPFFDGAIAELGLPGPVVGLCDTIFGWMIAAEIKAANATPAA